MKDEIKPTPGATDEQDKAGHPCPVSKALTDLAAANRLADKVFWEVFGPRGDETLQ